MDPVFISAFYPDHLSCVRKGLNVKQLHLALLGMGVMLLLYNRAASVWYTDGDDDQINEPR